MKSGFAVYNVFEESEGLDLVSLVFFHNNNWSLFSKLNSGQFGLRLHNLIFRTKMAVADAVEKSEGSEAKAAKIPPENKRTEEVSDSDDDDEEMPGLEDSANADGDKKDDVSFNFCENNGAFKKPFFLKT